MLSKTHVFKGSQRKFDQKNKVWSFHTFCCVSLHCIPVFHLTWWFFQPRGGVLLFFVGKEHLCVELFCVAQTNFCKCALVSTTQFRLLKTNAIAKVTLLPHFVSCVFNNFVFSQATTSSFLLHCHCNFAQPGQFAVKQAKKSTFLAQKIQNAY